MGLFGSLATSASGLDVFKTWMDATADNISNMQSISTTPGGQPFKTELVIAQANGDVTDSANHGAHVVDIVRNDEAPHPQYDPQNPYADPQTGEVNYPGVDLGTEMVNMVAAQRGYQANLQAFQYAKDAYQAALRLGH
jgi:flagellar basal-body rod protein FlgC